MLYVLKPFYCTSAICVLSTKKLILGKNGLNIFDRLLFTIFDRLLFTIFDRLLFTMFDIYSTTVHSAMAISNSPSRMVHPSLTTRPAIKVAENASAIVTYKSTLLHAVKLHLWLPFCPTRQPFQMKIRTPPRRPRPPLIDVPL